MSNLNDQIEKYLKGELSDKERHELEMKALHDPFLGEALEGAESINPQEFSNDVRDINLKVNRVKTRSSFWPMGIAASILAIITITYFIFQSGPDETSKQLALQEIPVSEEDSKRDEKDSSTVLELQAENIEKEKSTVEQSTVKPLQEKATQITESDKAEPKSTLPTEEPVEESKQFLAEAEEDYVAEKEIAEDLAMNKNQADEEVEMFAEHKSEPLRARSQSLKKKAQAAPATAGAGLTQASRTEIGASAKPAIPKEEYEKYLKDNFKKPQPAIDNGIRGNIKLSFIVNTDGQLSDFKIEQSVGFGCEDELIRVIKAGPTWSPATSGNTFVSERVTVNFQVD